MRLSFAFVTCLWSGPSFAAVQDCSRGDAACLSVIGNGSFCKYWASAPTCHGSNIHCACDGSLPIVPETPPSVAPVVSAGPALNCSQADLLCQESLGDSTSYCKGWLAEPHCHGNPGLRCNCVQTGLTSNTTDNLTTATAPRSDDVVHDSPLPSRIIYGALDFELERILELARTYIPDIPIVSVIPEGTNPFVARGLAYNSSFAPQSGELWIECGPGPITDGAVPRPRVLQSSSQQVVAAGAHLIDHHFPGDPGFGKPPAEAFNASSLGQFIHWLQSVGINHEPSARDIWIGEMDHARAACLAGSTSTPREQAFDFLPDAVKANMREAIAVLESAPLIEFNHTGIRDLRSCPEFEQRARLADVLIDACCYAGIPAVNWGMQGIRPNGRHIGFFGAGEGSIPGVIQFHDLLRTLGAVGIYGDVNRGIGGGYVPLTFQSSSRNETHEA
jgi:hypothetical protein